MSSLVAISLSILYENGCKQRGQPEQEVELSLFQLSTGQDDGTMQDNLSQGNDSVVTLNLVTQKTKVRGGKEVRLTLVTYDLCPADPTLYQWRKFLSCVQWVKVVPPKDGRYE